VDDSILTTELLASAAISAGDGSASQLAIKTAKAKDTASDFLNMNGILCCE
jgi:hypothetical protein